MDCLNFIWLGYLLIAFAVVCFIGLTWMLHTEVGHQRKILESKDIDDLTEEEVNSFGQTVMREYLRKRDIREMFRGKRP